MRHVLIRWVLQENTAEEGEDVRLEVLFPNSITGAVIGRSGETIKELRSKTNTQILVSYFIILATCRTTTLD